MPTEAAKEIFSYIESNNFLASIVKGAGVTSIFSSIILFGDETLGLVSDASVIYLMIGVVFFSYFVSGMSVFGSTKLRLANGILYSMLFVAMFAFEEINLIIMPFLVFMMAFSANQSGVKEGIKNLAAAQLTPQVR